MFEALRRAVATTDRAAKVYHPPNLHRARRLEAA